MFRIFVLHVEQRWECFCVFELHNRISTIKIKIHKPNQKNTNKHIKSYYFLKNIRNNYISEVQSTVSISDRNNVSASRRPFRENHLCQNPIDLCYTHTHTRTFTRNICARDCVRAADIRYFPIAVCRMPCAESVYLFSVSHVCVCVLFERVVCARKGAI